MPYPGVIPDGIRTGEGGAKKIARDASIARDRNIHTTVQQFETDQPPLEDFAGAAVEAAGGAIGAVVAGGGVIAVEAAGGVIAGAVAAGAAIVEAGAAPF
jgi:hypothetical protein